MRKRQNPPQSPFKKGEVTMSPPLKKGGVGGFALFAEPFERVERSGLLLKDWTTKP